MAFENLAELFGMFTLGGDVIAVILLFVMILLGLPLLALIAKIFRLDTSFEKMMTVSLLTFTIYFIAAIILSYLGVLGLVVVLPLSVIVGIYMFKRQYSLNARKASLAWFIWMAAYFAIWAILFVIGAVIFAFKP